MSKMSMRSKNLFRLPRRRLCRALFGVPAAALLAAFLAMGPAGPGLSDTAAAERPGISGDPNKPRRHFRVSNPKDLKPAEAQAVYDRLRKSMAGGYGLSGHPAAKAYQKWRRYNKTPYRSASHGQRYLNTYANAKGAAYGRFEKAGRLPAGAVIAKDSFMVSDEGAISAGPLFLMEKMPEGFHYVSADWRYAMIMPDGSLFGETGGENAAAVEFCISCHLAAERYDHLHFMPGAVRVKAK